MKRRTSVLAMARMIAGLIMPAKMAFADNNLPAFTALWWEWALSIPAPSNPTLDTTGADCMIGQRDFIWLLAGNGVLSGSVSRTCTVPENKTLFFPVINAVFVNTPKCGQMNKNFSVAEERAMIKPLIDDVGICRSRSMAKTRRIYCSASSQYPLWLRCRKTTFLALTHAGPEYLSRGGFIHHRWTMGTMSRLHHRVGMTPFIFMLKVPQPKTPKMLRIS